MSVSAPGVAIVIVTYNSAHQLDACLESIPAGCDGVALTEIVVVDNASADDSLGRAARHTDLPVRTVQLGRNAGYRRRGQRRCHRGLATRSGPFSC